MTFADGATVGPPSPSGGPYEGSDPLDVATQCRDRAGQVVFLICRFDAFGHPLPDQRGRSQMRPASGRLDGLVDSGWRRTENTIAAARPGFVSMHFTHTSVSFQLRRAIAASGSCVHERCPQAGLGGGPAAQLADGMVQRQRGVLWVERAVGEQVGIDGGGDVGSGGIPHRPQSTDDVPPTGMLQRGDQRDGFVKDGDTADSGLAGGQERELTVVVAVGADLGDGQDTVLQQNTSLGRFAEILPTVTGEVYPPVTVKSLTDRPSVSIRSLQDGGLVDLLGTTTVAARTRRRLEYGYNLVQSGPVRR